MAGRRQGLSQTPALLSAVVAGLLLTACGSDGAQPEATGAKPTRLAKSVHRHGEAIEECLIEVGVQFAVVPHDIAFLGKAQRNHNVVDRGSGYEPQEEVVVRLLTARPGGAAQWTVWYSQPPAESLSPRQILEKSPPHSYVAFKLRPKPSFRREVAKCVAFPRAPG